MNMQSRPDRGKNGFVRVGFAAATLFLCSVVNASSVDWWLDIANDRIASVKTALAQGEEPNSVNASGQPALMQAIRDGAWGVYDLLVAHRKIDVNAANKNNETPLMYLAIVGDTKRAQALINRGAQVNRLGWTPLHYAASKAQLDMVKLLIDNKALVDAPSPDGTTALMMAAFAGSSKVVQVLLNAGAEVTTQNLGKQDAADWARMKEHTALAEKLDGLTQRVLKDRAAAQARNRALEASAPGAGAGAGVTELMPAGINQGAGLQNGSGAGEERAETLDIREPVAQPSAQDSRADKPSDKQPDQAEPASSTSRYFDLGRFDKEPAY